MLSHEPPLHLLLLLLFLLLLLLLLLLLPPSPPPPPPPPCVTQVFVFEDKGPGDASLYLLEPRRKVSKAALLAGLPIPKAQCSSTDPNLFGTKSRAEQAAREANVLKRSVPNWLYTAKILGDLLVRICDRCRMNWLCAWQFPSRMNCRKTFAFNWRSGSSKNSSE